MMRALLVGAALIAAVGCGAHTGAWSPNGRRHPGTIVCEDKVNGRIWTQRASEVPRRRAWVKSEGKWFPVVKVVITGAANLREITYFGPDDRFLETTTGFISSPSRPPEQDELGGSQ
jgi:hypothetical protein